MFRGIRSLATEIGSDIDGKIRSTNEQLVGKPISAATSRTKRFLRRSADNPGSSASSSSSPGFSFRSKHKDWEEIDGTTEDDTVVHRALVQHFKQQGKSLPAYLVTYSADQQQRRPIARTNTAPPTMNTSQLQSKPQSKPQSQSQSQSQSPTPTPAPAPMSRPHTTRFHSRFGNSSAGESRPPLATGNQGSSSTRFVRRT
ncbi:hypothetical protein CANINC_001113 [Pichia inconspicua]|uniref:Mso1 N-terminal domain-containing protein n=1 Tax=Pichia inconspicua TaxID=52247 RepID=A0A4T0X4G2_9ASCO|nr:hypothetical protein CANINC_001113 [[Candida] inconspicua]